MRYIRGRKEQLNESSEEEQKKDRDLDYCMDSCNIRDSRGDSY